MPRAQDRFSAAFLFQPTPSSLHTSKGGLYARRGDARAIRDRNGLAGTQTTILEDPDAGEAYTYLVTVETAAGEHTLGADSDGVERLNGHPCP